MKIKKLIASIMVVVVALVSLTSFNVSAVGYKFDKFEITATSYDDFTYTELNNISDGLRQSINDATAENVGCKITLHFKYVSPCADNPQMMLAVNWNNIHNFYQVKELDGNTVTFDWDTILSKCNFKQRQGLVTDITLGTNQSITITSVEVYIPTQKAVASLAAGAPCYKYATPIVVGGSI